MVAQDTYIKSGAADVEKVATLAFEMLSKAKETADRLFAMIKEKSLSRKAINEAKREFDIYMAEFRDLKERLFGSEKVPQSIKDAMTAIGDEITRAQQEAMAAADAECPRMISNGPENTKVYDDIRKKRAEYEALSGVPLYVNPKLTGKVPGARPEISDNSKSGKIDLTEEAEKEFKKIDDLLDGIPDKDSAYYHKAVNSAGYFRKQFEKIQATTLNEDISDIGEYAKACCSIELLSHVSVLREEFEKFFTLNKYASATSRWFDSEKIDQIEKDSRLMAEKDQTYYYYRDLAAKKLGIKYYDREDMLAVLFAAYPESFMKTQTCAIGSEMQITAENRENVYTLAFKIAAEADRDMPDEKLQQTDRVLEAMFKDCPEESRESLMESLKNVVNGMEEKENRKNLYLKRLDNIKDVYSKRIDGVKSRVDDAKSRADEAKSKAKSKADKAKSKQRSNDEIGL